MRDKWTLSWYETPICSHNPLLYNIRNFDRSLRMRDPAWGVRDLEAVVEEAKQYGLTFVDKIEMPANNLVVLYRKD
jgi:hypothetical protein